MRGRTRGSVGLALLFVCLSFFALGARADAAQAKDFLKGREVESLADGRMTDLGALSKGKPFYVVFSTPT